MASPGVSESARSHIPGSPSSKSPSKTISNEPESDPHATVPVSSNEDSDSDVSMSADSDDGDEDSRALDLKSDQTLPTTEPSPSATTRAEAENPKKRKQTDFMDDTPLGHAENRTSHLVSKRFRPDDSYQTYWTTEGLLRQDRSTLPAEIWHRIFTFTPPRVLGQLLQVNKKFNAYLDPSSPSIHYTPLFKSLAQVLKPDTIWQASRKLFRPTVPSPLAGKSELDMWRLACCISCQFCGKKRQPSHMPQMDQWHPGPGKIGVIPVWSFGARCCGPCLQEQTVKEIELLLSSAVPTPLLAALPFVHLTNESHVIPTAILQKGHEPPPSIQIKKHFFKQNVENLKQEFLDVKANMGTATLEEWLKGLDDRGKEIRNDAARWERWEASGGVARMRRVEPNEIQIRVDNRIITPTGLPNLPAKIPSTNGSLPNLPPVPYFSQPPSNQGIFPKQPPLRYDSPAHGGIPPYSTRPNPQPRHERTKEEVAELKAARRAEIERRSMLLDPPILPGVLAHMSSFQAATQIIQPLNDGAWEVLKPRLLSQRDEAEQREKDRLAQTRVVLERFDASRWQGNKSDDSKEVVERDWEDVQGPLRTRIGGYADEIIRDGWNGGQKVTRDTCTAFAAEVLVYVRKRFYAEVAKDEGASNAAGQTLPTDPPNGPFTRKLVLENMKWLFDTRIKPITEQYRKELFLCADCDGNFKYYGFEGVIQHYAAKHTTALSLGSIVVHWKAEWPEYPPFKADPSTTGHSFYNAGPSVNDLYANGHSGQQYAYGGYQTAAVSVPIQGPPHAYQDGQAPFYGQPQFGDRYQGHQHGPYPPPQQPYMDPSQGYPETPYPGLPPNGTGNGYNQGPTPDYSQRPYPSQYPPHNPYENSHQHQPYHPVPDQGGNLPSYPTHPPIYDQPYNQQPGYRNDSYQQAAPLVKPIQTEEYKAQLLDIASAARDVWKALTGVKEVPGSVKVYAILYHILKKSRAKYPGDPPLSMITDGLNNNKDMRQVRNVNGLLCRACVLGMAGSQGQERKHFSFPQLVNHFRSVHEIAVVEKSLGHVPDWTRDMVELPNAAKLSAVARAPGLDDKKLRLLAEALPEIAPKPVTQEDRRSGPTPEAYVNASIHGGYELAPSQDNHEKFYKFTEFRRSPDVEVYRPEKNGRQSKQDFHQEARRFEQPLYADRAIQLREGEHVEGPGQGSYDPADPVINYRHTNTHAYNVNAEDLPTIMARIAEEKKVSASRDQPRPVETPSTRGIKIKQEPSEDGEVRAELAGPHMDDPAKAAERFLNDLIPLTNGQSKSRDEAVRPRHWESDQGERRVYSPEPRRGAIEDGRIIPIGRATSQFQEVDHHNGYAVHERIPSQSRPARGYGQDGRYLDAMPSKTMPRERSPELVDRRYVMNNTVYREERANSQGMHRTPSRYARYESVRLENDRARSRSPIYVKVGDQPGQYRERSPPRHLPQEPIYRTRSPQGHPGEVAYERAARPEYYRVYADEPRPRQPQYTEAYELVQVSHPDGDYMVRRPVRREPEPIYVDRATYENEMYETYSRKPVYESFRQAPPVSQPDPYEEYDPRHPAPLPPANAVRHVRYQ
ncbi:hypothetical protein BP6252_00162 [Coleophoma cylindrospora]|uniref:DUF7892 domain-containing protein n=1 Tax=Coleophoma cylindrospora TaxID=1849047 RepID=A0A3D8SP89_9HELO|nr:hypothetical protein BP6252_00162 [Coleophoma cylindrospora]